MSDDRVLLLEPEDALVQDDAPAPRLRFEWHADEHGELLPYIEGDHIDRLEQLQEELNRLREKRRRAARMVTIMPRERMGKVQKYIGRIVVVLTPLFVGLVAYGATQVEKLPGHPQLNQTEIVALMVLGAGAVLPGVVTWLVNLGKHERQVLADKHDRAREDAWRAAQPEIGEFGELLGKSIEDAVPLLREHLGLNAKIPGAETVLLELDSILAMAGQISNAVGALEERVGTIESGRSHTACTPIPADRGGSAD
jgi:hypothetical protein